MGRLRCVVLDGTAALCGAVVAPSCVISSGNVDGVVVDKIFMTVYLHHQTGVAYRLSSPYLTTG
jgi:hypothetical protein